MNVVIWPDQIISNYCMFSYLNFLKADIRGKDP
jgi:hypothetical protein